MNSFSTAEVKRSFKAMGTTFEVTCAAKDLHILFEMERYAHSLERMWTRFNDSSELMQLNINAGQTQFISGETRSLLQEMKRGFLLSEGMFNPGILPIMQRNGFDAAETKLQQIDYCPTEAQALWDEVRIETDSATLPKGLAIDAGGIGKGLAADLLAQRAIDYGAYGVVINAGGEVAVRGTSVNPNGWSVGIENPFAESEILTTVHLAEGGLATSAPSGWTIGTKSHIVDPRIGQAIETKTAQATVLSARTVDAEVLAKMCLLFAIPEALERVELIGASAFIVDSDLNTYASESWINFI